MLVKWVGKSTIFNLITGLINLEMVKLKLWRNACNTPYTLEQKFKLGYVPQYGGYFNDLTLHDNLKAISESY